MLLLLTTVLALGSQLSVGGAQLHASAQATVNSGGKNVATQSAKVTALPECSSRFMIVSLKFNRSLISEFFDWIVIGTNSNAACRHQGRGETDFILEIPLINDPCGTKMVDHGTFENVIRIGQNPLIILRGDELITVRCYYAPPAVGPEPVVPIALPGAFEATYPTLAPVFHAGGSGASRNAPGKVARAGAGFDAKGVSAGAGGVNRLNGKAATAVREKSTGAHLDYAYVYYLVLPMLLLALLCMVCGCLFALVKRRKVRFESRKHNGAGNRGMGSAISPMGNAAGAEMGKLGIGNLWWTGGPNADPLLSHDYMIGSNSTKEAFAAMSATSEANTSPTSSAAGDEANLTGNGQQREPPPPRYDGYESVERAGGTGFDRPLTVAVPVSHESSGGKAHHGRGASPTPAPRSRNSQSGGGGATMDVKADAPRSYSEWKAELMTRPHEGQTVADLYTPVDRNAKRQQHNQHQQSKAPNDAGGKFRATPVKVTDGLEEADRSITQLNSAGLSGYLQLEQVNKADRPDGRGDNNAAGGQAAGSSSTLEEKPDSLGQVEQRRRWLDECVRTVRRQFAAGQRDRGRAHTAPNADDIERFVGLIEADELFANWLWRAAGVHDYETLSRRPQYSRIMNREKWTSLIHTLAQLNYMKRLDGILDGGAAVAEHHQQHSADRTLMRDADERGPIVEQEYGGGAGASYSDHGGKRRYVKRAHAPQAANAPRKAQPDEVITACSPTSPVEAHTAVASPSQRHFTHNSFTRTKQELTFVGVTQHIGGCDNVDRDTTEVQEGERSVARRHHTPSNPPSSDAAHGRGAPPRQPNPLQLYVGDVRTRPLPQAVRDRLDGATGANGRYAAMLESSASFASTTYGQWRGEGE